MVDAHVEVLRHLDDLALHGQPVGQQLNGLVGGFDAHHHHPDADGQHGEADQGEGEANEERRHEQRHGKHEAAQQAEDAAHQRENETDNKQGIRPNQAVVVVARHLARRGGRHGDLGGSFGGGGAGLVVHARHGGCGQRQSAAAVIAVGLEGGVVGSTPGAGDHGRLLR